MKDVFAVKFPDAQCANRLIFAHHVNLWILTYTFQAKMGILAYCVIFNFVNNAIGQIFVLNVQQTINLTVIRLNVFYARQKIVKNANKLINAHLANK